MLVSGRVPVMQDMNLRLCIKSLNLSIRVSTRFVIIIITPPPPPHNRHYHDDHHHNHRHCNGSCSLLSLRTGRHGLPIVAGAGRNTQLGGEN